MLAAVALACSAEVVGSAEPAERARAVVADRTFDLELALDPATRQRGLSGRSEIPARGGMLFVWPSPRPLAMVMRDCRVPIDVAFLDDAGWVLAVHAMRVEPRRRPGESRFAYEARLPRYPSGRPARVAIEVAGGLLAELGVSPGQRIAIEGARELLQRAR